MSPTGEKAKRKRAAGEVAAKRAAPDNSSTQAAASNSRARRKVKPLAPSRMLGKPDRLSANGGRLFPDKAGAPVVEKGDSTGAAAGSLARTARAQEMIVIPDNGAVRGASSAAKDGAGDAVASGATDAINYRDDNPNHTDDDQFFDAEVSRQIKAAASAASEVTN